MNDQHQNNGEFPQQGYNGQPQQGYYGQPQQFQPQQPPKKKNWFLRHKILTAILAIFVIAAFGSAAGGGKSGNSASSSPSSTTQAAADNKASDAAKSSDASEAPKSEEATGDKLPGVGTPVRDGKFEFTITKVQRGVKSVGESFMAENAQGEFTILSVTVKNIGDKPQTIFDSNQKAFTASGQEYSPSTSASIAMPNNSDFFIKEVNPGNSVKGYLVFDAPAGSKLTKVELHDSMFSGGVSASIE